MRGVQSILFALTIIFNLALSLNFQKSPSHQSLVKTTSSSDPLTSIPSYLLRPRHSIPTADGSIPFNSLPTATTATTNPDSARHKFGVRDLLQKFESRYESRFHISLPQLPTQLGKHTSSSTEKPQNAISTTTRGSKASGISMFAHLPFLVPSDQCVSKSIVHGITVGPQITLHPPAPLRTVQATGRWQSHNATNHNATNHNATNHNAANHNITNQNVTEGMPCDLAGGKGVLRRRTAPSNRSAQTVRLSQSKNGTNVTHSLVASTTYIDLECSMQVHAVAIPHVLLGVNPIPENAVKHPHKGEGSKVASYHHKARIGSKLLPVIPQPALGGPQQVSRVEAEAAPPVSSPAAPVQASPVNESPQKHQSPQEQQPATPGDSAPETSVATNPILVGHSDRQGSDPPANQGASPAFMANLHAALQVSSAPQQSSLPAAPVKAGAGPSNAEPVSDSGSVKPDSKPVASGPGSTESDSKPAYSGPGGTESGSKPVYTGPGSIEPGSKPGASGSGSIEPDSKPGASGSGSIEPGSQSVASGSGSTESDSGGGSPQHQQSPHELPQGGLSVPADGVAPAFADVYGVPSSTQPSNNPHKDESPKEGENGGYAAPMSPAAPNAEGDKYSGSANFANDANQPFQLSTTTTVETSNGHKITKTYAQAVPISIPPHDTSRPFSLSVNGPAYEVSSIMTTLSSNGHLITQTLPTTVQIPPDSNGFIQLPASTTAPSPGGIVDYVPSSFTTVVKLSDGTLATEVVPTVAAVTEQSPPPGNVIDFSTSFLTTTSKLPDGSLTTMTLPNLVPFTHSLPSGLEVSYLTSSMTQVVSESGGLLLTEVLPTVIPVTQTAAALLATDPGGIIADTQSGPPSTMSLTGPYTLPGTATGFEMPSQLISTSTPTKTPSSAAVRAVKSMPLEFGSWWDVSRSIIWASSWCVIFSMWNFYF